VTTLQFVTRQFKFEKNSYQGKGDKAMRTKTKIKAGIAVWGT